MKYLTLIIIRLLGFDTIDAHVGPSVFQCFILPLSAFESCTGEHIIEMGRTWYKCCKSASREALDALFPSSASRTVFMASVTLFLIRFQSSAVSISINEPSSLEDESMW